MLIPFALAIALAAQDFQIDEATLARVTAEVMPAIRDDLGPSFSKPITVRLATRKEIESILTDENALIMRGQFDTEEAARKAAKVFARTLSSNMVAKYRFGKWEVLVNPKTFESLAELLELPELNTESTLRAVLVHEIAHAASDELFGMSTTITNLSDANRIQAYNAVMEGYAQLVARRVCAQNGWLPGFEVFSNSIGRMPPQVLEGGEAMVLMARQQSALAVSWYRDGEAFMGALFEEGGRAAVERAFRSPPESMTIISRPNWFLHPETRPKIVFDFDRGLDYFSKHYSEDEWFRRRGKVTEVQLRTGLAILGAENVDRVFKPFRNGLGQSFALREDPANVSAQLSLYEFATPAAASAFAAALRSLSEAKDKSMREGTIRITEAFYEPLGADCIDGFLAAKTVDANGQTITVNTLVGTKGSICAEVLFTNGEPDLEDAIGQMCAAIARSQKSD